MKRAPILVGQCFRHPLGWIRQVVAVDDNERPVWITYRERHQSGWGELYCTEQAFQSWVYKYKLVPFERDEIPPELPDVPSTPTL